LLHGGGIKCIKKGWFKAILLSGVIVSTSFDKKYKPPVEPKP